MRFEVISALVMGVLLPTLETIRRGLDHWAVNFTTMFEDYVAGGLLLVAGFVSTQSKPNGPLLLLAAWAYVTGMMGGSFWDQLESTLRGVELEPNNAVILVFKLLLWGTCVVSLVLSFRRAFAENRRGQGD